MENTSARRAAWGVATFLCLLTGAYAVMIVASGFEALPEDIASNSFLTPGGIRFHIAVVAAAIIVAPWQFARTIRNRFPLVHRTMGRTYLVSGFVGIATGTVIALGSAQGLIAGFGFLFLGIAWLMVTTVAYRMILRRDYEAHRRWMLRSFALIFGAVTLRLYIPVSNLVGIEFESSYPVIAWINWVPNILLMEWWIRREAPHRIPEQLSDLSTPVNRASQDRAGALDLRVQVTESPKSGS